jgi:4-phosphopantoate--beta-alanine ligase
VLSGVPKRLLPLSHDRAFCLEEGIYSADTILVPLEDGDRCSALRGMGKNVIAIDINPLSRTARTASLTIVDELTRALPNISSECRKLINNPAECTRLINSHDNNYLIRTALEEIMENLSNALD